MILYNVSLIIEDSSHDDLLTWLKAKLQKTNYQLSFLKMLDSPHEGSTYCIQLNAENHEMLEAFQKELLADLQQHIALQHRDKAFIFDSKMEYLTF